MTVKLPRLGDTVDEVYLLQWNKKAGDRIEAGESLGEVETDKATVEVPTPVSGTIIELFFNNGDAIKTGDAIAILESD